MFSPVAARGAHERPVAEQGLPLTMLHAAAVSRQPRGRDGDGTPGTDTQPATATTARPSGPAGPSPHQSPLVTGRAARYGFTAPGTRVPTVSAGPHVDAPPTVDVGEGTRGDIDDSDGSSSSGSDSSSDDGGRRRRRGRAASLSQYAKGLSPDARAILGSSFDRQLMQFAAVLQEREAQQADQRRVEPAPTTVGSAPELVSLARAQKRQSKRDLDASRAAAVAEQRAAALLAERQRARAAALRTASRHSQMPDGGRGTPTRPPSGRNTPLSPAVATLDSPVALDARRRRSSSRASRGSSGGATAELYGFPGAATAGTGSGDGDSPAASARAAQSPSPGQRTPPLGRALHSLPGSAGTSPNPTSMLVAQGGLEPLHGRYAPDHMPQRSATPRGDAFTGSSPSPPSQRRGSSPPHRRGSPGGTDASVGAGTYARGGAAASPSRSPSPSRTAQRRQSAPAAVRDRGAGHGGSEPCGGGGGGTSGVGDLGAGVPPPPMPLPPRSPHHHQQKRPQSAHTRARAPAGPDLSLAVVGSNTGGPLIRTEAEAAGRDTTSGNGARVNRRVAFAPTSPTARRPASAPMYGAGARRTAARPGGHASAHAWQGDHGNDGTGERHGDARRRARSNGHGEVQSTPQPEPDPNVVLHVAGRERRSAGFLAYIQQLASDAAAMDAAQAQRAARAQAAKQARYKYAAVTSRLHWRTSGSIGGRGRDSGQHGRGAQGISWTARAQARAHVIHAAPPAAASPARTHARGADSRAYAPPVPPSVTRAVVGGAGVGAVRRGSGPPPRASPTIVPVTVPAKPSPKPPFITARGAALSHRAPAASASGTRGGHGGTGAGVGDRDLDGADGGGGGGGGGSGGAWEAWTQPSNQGEGGRVSQWHPQQRCRDVSANHYHDGGCAPPATRGSPRETAPHPPTPPPPQAAPAPEARAVWANGWGNEHADGGSHGDYAPTAPPPRVQQLDTSPSAQRHQGEPAPRTTVVGGHRRRTARPRTASLGRTWRGRGAYPRTVSFARRRRRRASAGSPLHASSRNPRVRPHPRSRPLSAHDSRRVALGGGFRAGAGVGTAATGDADDATSPSPQPRRWRRRRRRRKATVGGRAVRDGDGSGVSSCGGSASDTGSGSDAEVGGVAGQVQAQVQEQASRPRVVVAPAQHRFNGLEARPPRSGFAPDPRAAQRPVRPSYTERSMANGSPGGTPSPTLRDSPLQVVRTRDGSHDGWVHPVAKLAFTSTGAPKEPSRMASPLPASEATAQSSADARLHMAASPSAEPKRDGEAARGDDAASVSAAPGGDVDGSVDVGRRDGGGGDRTEGPHRHTSDDGVAEAVPTDEAADDVSAAKPYLDFAAALTRHESAATGGDAASVANTLPVAAVHMAAAMGSVPHRGGVPLQLADFNRGPTPQRGQGRVPSPAAYTFVRRAVRPSEGGVQGVDPAHASPMHSHPRPRSAVPSSRRQVRGSGSNGSGGSPRGGINVPRSYQQTPGHSVDRMARGGSGSGLRTRTRPASAGATRSPRRRQGVHRGHAGVMDPRKWRALFTGLASPIAPRPGSVSAASPALDAGVSLASSGGAPGPNARSPGDGAATRPAHLPPGESVSASSMAQAVQGMELRHLHAYFRRPEPTADWSTPASSLTPAGVQVWHKYTPAFTPGDTTAPRDIRGTSGGAGGSDVQGFSSRGAGFWAATGGGEGDSTMVTPVARLHFTDGGSTAARAAGSDNSAGTPGDWQQHIEAAWFMPSQAPGDGSTRTPRGSRVRRPQSAKMARPGSRVHHVSHGGSGGASGHRAKLKRRGSTGNVNVGATGDATVSPWGADDVDDAAFNRAAHASSAAPAHAPPQPSPMAPGVGLEHDQSPPTAPPPHGQRSVHVPPAADTLHDAGNAQGGSPSDAASRRHHRGRGGGGGGGGRRRGHGTQAVLARLRRDTASSKAHRDAATTDAESPKGKAAQRKGASTRAGTGTGTGRPPLPRHGRKLKSPRRAAQAGVRSKGHATGKHGRKRGGGKGKAGTKGTGKRKQPSSGHQMPEPGAGGTTAPHAPSKDLDESQAHRRRELQRVHERRRQRMARDARRVSSGGVRLATAAASKGTRAGGGTHHRRRSVTSADNDSAAVPSHPEVDTTPHGDLSRPDTDASATVGPRQLQATATAGNVEGGGTVHGVGAGRGAARRRGQRWGQQLRESPRARQKRIRQLVNNSATADMIRGVKRLAAKLEERSLALRELMLA